MRDDVAFQSQQFAEQVAQRRDRYSAQNIQSWQQLPEMATRFQGAMAQQMHMQQAQQAHQMDLARGAQALALDQMRVEQARQELAWSKDLHAADMLAAQKRTVLAQADLAVAQAQKAKEDLESTGMEHFPRFDEEHMWTMRAMGLQADTSGRRITVVPIPEGDRAAARKEAEENLRRIDAQKRAGYGGGIPDPFRILASGNIPDGSPTGRKPQPGELEQARKSYIDFKQATYASQDARELAAIARTAQVIGATVDKLEFIKGNEGIVTELKQALKDLIPVLNKRVQSTGGEDEDDTNTLPAIQQGGGEPDDLETGLERITRILEEARKRGGK